MTPEMMAAAHARAFSGHGQAWSAEDFRTLLQSTHVFHLGGARAFAVGRAIADEAELLTLATDPVHRRTGLARACLHAFEVQAAARGAASAFLEVSEENAAARALYEGAHYTEVGRRKNYYTTGNGTHVDALVLSKRLI